MSDAPNPAAENEKVKEAPAAGGIPAEWLETSDEEAGEIAQMIAAGHRAGGVTGAFTFIGVVLMIVAFFCYRFDRMPGQVPFANQLTGYVNAQAEKDFAAFGTRSSAPVAPYWPMLAQSRAHDDAFLAAGLALLLGFVFLQIERAKLRRQDLLVYRALAREIEKDRRRLVALEAIEKSDGTPAKAAE